MRNGIKIGRIRGIDVSIHWSWVLAIIILTWWLGVFYHQHYGSWSWGVSYAVGGISGILLFVTVLLHELAHSFVARAKGLPVTSISLFIFGGVSNLSREPGDPLTELLMTIAGPLTSMALALIFFLLYKLSAGWPAEVSAVLGYLASVNVLLALFNLIPGFPLDGGRVLRSLLWMAMHNRRRATHIAGTVGQGVGLVFILGGLFWAFFQGDILDGIWLAFIGWFLYNAATASYQQAVMDGVLHGVEVRTVMDRAPHGISATTDIESLTYEHMLSANQRAVHIQGPDGSLLGLVTLSDLGKVPRERWSSTPVTEIMTRAADLVTVTPGEDLRHALQCMAENRHHQLPVLEGNHLVGMLDRAHVVHWIHLREQLAPPPTSSPSELGRM